jgi:hypothetical protein
LVNVSGADVSQLKLNLQDEGALRGVVWDAYTVWPAEIAARVHAWSREIRPGVFQVGGGSERDPSLTTI